MPHKSQTKEDGEKVVAMSLPLSFHWSSTLLEINAGNLQLRLKEVTRIGLSRICSESFSKFSTKKQGDNFTRCGDCDDLKQMRLACSLLMYHGVFQEVYINFLIVGHTHDDIDAFFGRWSYKLRETNYPIFPLLIKSFMDIESRLVIPHLIEKVPNFKKLWRGTCALGVMHW